MYIFMYMYLYIYLYVYIFICIYLYIYVFIYIYIYIYIFICIYLYKFIYIYIFKYIYIDKYTRISMHTNAHGACAQAFLYSRPIFYIYYSHASVYTYGNVQDITCSLAWLLKQQQTDKELVY